MNNNVSRRAFTLQPCAQEQGAAAQEKEELSLNSVFRQLIEETCGTKVCEEQKQNMEDTMLDLLKICQQKERYCIHNNVEDLMESALNSKLLLINLNSQRLNKEEQEVKNIAEPAAKLVPLDDESSPTFTTFSDPLFDSNDDFTSSDDESLSDEDILKENFKIYSNPLFDDEEIFLQEIDPHSFKCESNFIDSFLIEADFDLEEEIRLVENLSYDNSSPRPPKELNAENVDTIIESPSPSPIPVADSDFLMEEIDLFLASDDSMPPGIENDDYDSEGDIRFLEELLSNDSPPLPENESSNLDHFNDPSSPRPPPEPPDVEVFFDFEPDMGVLTTKVVKGISEHYVLMPNILPTLPTLDPDLDFTPSHDSLGSGNKIFDPGIFIEVQSERLLSRDEFSISFIRDPLSPVFDTLLPFLSKNEDKVFNPGILISPLLSHQGEITSNFYKSPMMISRGDIPHLDVPYLHFYPPWPSSSFADSCLAPFVEIPSGEIKVHIEVLLCCGEIDSWTMVGSHTDVAVVKDLGLENMSHNPMLQSLLKVEEITEGRHMFAAILGGSQTDVAAF
ncbi:hypothetical protein Tco_0500329 [Tanacetum coccineum]